MDLVPRFPQGKWLPEVTFWFYVLGFLAPRLGFLSARTWSLNPWTWFHGCLVKITVFFDLRDGSLDLVPSLSGESLSMPGLTSWFPGHGCLDLVPGCLDSVPGFLDLVS